MTEPVPTPVPVVPVPDAPVIETPVVEAAPAREATQEWDGDFTKLDAQEWWKNVPESARTHLKGDKEQRDFLKTLLDSDDTIRTASIEREALNKTLSATTAERDEWKGKYETQSKDFKDYVNVQEEKRLNDFDTMVKTTYSDIYAAVEKDAAGEITGGALLEFVRLVETMGLAPEKAAKAVRAMFDMPTPALSGAAPAVEDKPKTRDVTPPMSVQLANANGLNPAQAIEKPAPITPEEARRRIQRKIEEEEAAADLVG